MSDKNTTDPAKSGAGIPEKDQTRARKEDHKGAKGLSQSHAGHYKPRYGGGYPRSTLSQSQADPSRSGEEEKHASSKGSTGMATEVFEKPEIPELALNHKWTIWELVETKGQANYNAGMEKVAWFGDAVTFWKVWNKIPHSDPTNFFAFEREGKNYINYYEIKGSHERINTLAMFKTGIHPEWEDATNKNGGEYATKITIDIETTKEIWNNLVLNLVTSNFPATDKVCGIRIVDKGKFIKVELWVDYGLRKYCEDAKAQEEKLIEICEEAGASSVKFEFKAHC